jgi:DNA-binding response OmpR family regulator
VLEHDIIVLEDDELCRSMIVKILRKAGYDPDQAANYEQLMKRCRDRNTPVKLLVVDLLLPGRHGTEAALQLVAMYPGLKMLFVSGTPLEGWDQPDVDRFQRLPEEATRFLLKPFSPATLVATIDRMLGRIASAGAV